MWSLHLSWTQVRKCRKPICLSTLFLISAHQRYKYSTLSHTLCIVTVQLIISLSGSDMIWSYTSHVVAYNRKIESEPKLQPYASHAYKVVDDANTNRQWHLCRRCHHHRHQVVLLREHPKLCAYMDDLSYGIYLVTPHYQPYDLHISGKWIML